MVRKNILKDYPQYKTYIKDKRQNWPQSVFKAELFEKIKIALIDKSKETFRFQKCISFFLEMVIS